MRGATTLAATTVLASILCLPGCKSVTFDPYRIVHYGEISEGHSTQWEPSSAALPADQAERLCKAPPGDPQVFLSWVAGGQRTLSCAASELGRSGCDSDAPDALLFLDEHCPKPRLAAHSNDNDSMRLADGRVVTVFQTLERYCPGGSVHPSMPYAEAMFDGDGDEDERCEAIRGDEEIHCADLEECTENCAELTAFDSGDSSQKCGGGPIDILDHDDECAPYYEQVLYYTRLTSNCGIRWHGRRLEATKLKYTDGTEFRRQAGPVVEEDPVVALDRVEVYADPFSDNAFLTTNVGPWGGNDTALFLHAATPPGQVDLHWRVMFQDDGGGSPTVMTSVAHDGGITRVYWFNCSGSKPKLYFADNPWTLPRGASPNAHNLAAALRKAEGGMEFQYDCGHLPGGVEGSTFYTRNLGPTMSIARVATDGVNDVVRVVYSQLDRHEHGAYQTARVVDVRVPVRPPFTAVLPVTNRVLVAGKIPGADGKVASVLWPELIQSDQPTERDPAAATHLLRWTEIHGGLTHIERFAAWDPSKPWVGSSECPEWGDCDDRELWHPKHELDRWLCISECSPGDYQYGAFVQVLDRCSHDFFVPWVRRFDGDSDWFPESGRVHAAMVTTTTDRDPPVFDPEPRDVHEQCREKLPLAPSPTVWDDCDPEPEVEVEQEIRWYGGCPDRLELMRRWTATDNVGRESSVDQIVRFEDDRAPLLFEVPPDRTVDCDNVPEVARVVVTDNCDPDPVLTFNETRTEGDCSTGYQLIREWRAVDRCGNESTGKQHLEVRSTTPGVGGGGSADPAGTDP